MEPLNDFTLSHNIDAALRNIFKHEIKENFLIKIYHRVLDTLKQDIFLYYPYNLSLENSIINHLNRWEYDICKMIVGLHKSNTIFDSDEEKGRKQNEEKYQQKLVNEVIENIKLRQYGSYFFRQNQIVAGDRFLYFHLPYDLFVICTRMNELLIKNADKKPPFYNHISKISNIGLSTLSLLENNFLDNAYPLCRTIIELYIETLVLSHNSKSQNIYKDFSQIEFEKTQCGIDYPKDFLDKFDNRKKKNENKKNMYLHFGWVDEIENYHKIVKKNPYSVAGLIKYLKFKYPEGNYDIYERFYKQCHSYSHANPIGVAYPLLSYFEVSIMLFLAINNTYKYLCDCLEIDTNINGINIYEKTERDYELIVSQFNKRNTENFKEYYKE